ncbi:hypothetical protein [Janibacter sp. Soil728]|uniref:hypothetical protein n=1 Tax=Janibacter sp. Soil728 TaxID=1736393 RepID=UPI0012E8C5E2|nr:hypothetical protein [Janibacter sp. Soil728]
MFDIHRREWSDRIGEFASPVWPSKDATVNTGGNTGSRGLAPGKSQLVASRSEGAMQRHLRNKVPGSTRERTQNPHGSDVTNKDQS